MDGAVELSAGARPFIPKGFSPAFSSNNDTQHTQHIQRGNASLPFGQGHSLFMQGGSSNASGGIIGYGDAGSSWGGATSTSAGPFDTMGKLSLQLPHSLLSGVDSPCVNPTLHHPCPHSNRAVPSEARTQQHQQRSRGQNLGHPFITGDSSYAFELDEEATQQVAYPPNHLKTLTLTRCLPLLSFLRTWIASS